MKTEQPVSHQPADVSKTSRAENHSLGVAQTAPFRDATRSSAAFEVREKRVGGTQKWTRAQTYRFVFVLCGLFWLAVALAAWAYLTAR